MRNLWAVGFAVGIGCVSLVRAQTLLPEVQIRQESSPSQKPPAMPAPSLSPGAAFDQARARLLPVTGVNTTTLSQDALQNQPQGEDTPIEKTLLQIPGFSQDSAASGALHLRNDHANVQYRINGVLLPDGVSGFSQLLDTGFIGNLQVMSGALPAQYGLHTTGIVDITPRQSAFVGGGAVGVEIGSQGTISPSFSYGGSSGQTEY